MATFSLKPPSEQQIIESEKGTSGMEFLDPRSDTPEGKLVDMPEVIPAEVNYQPSRVSGSFTGDVPEGYSGGVDLKIAGDLARGFNDIVLALPDAGINLVMDALELAGVVDKQDQPRNFLSRVFNSSDYKTQKVIIPYLLHYGVDDYVGQSEEEGTAAKYARSGGQGVAMAAPFVGIMGRSATLSQAPANLLKPNATTGQRVRQSLLQPYVTAPKTAGTIELGLGASAAMGAQAEQDLFGTNTGGGALVGAFGLPGLFYGGKAAVTKGPIGRLFGWVGNKVTATKDEAAVIAGKKAPGEGPRGEKAQDLLTKEIEESVSTDVGRESLDRAKEIETAILGEGTLSPAEMTMDPILRRTQATLEEAGSSSFTRKNLERKSSNLKSIDNFINNELTGSPIDDAPTFVINQATKSYDNTFSKIDIEKNDIAHTFSGLSDEGTGAFPKITDRRQTGESIRAEIVTAQNIAKEEAEAVAKRLKVNTSDPMVKMDAFAEAKTTLSNALLTKTKGKALSYEGMNSKIKQFLNTDLKTISFQDWKRYRDQVSSEIGKAAVLGKKGELRDLAIFGKVLDDLAVNFGKTNKNFEEFRKYYDANVILPFEDGFVVKALAKRRGSTTDRPKYLLAGENIAETFLADSESATQFMLLFKDDPVMQSSMKGVVADTIRTQAYNPTKGRFNPDIVNKYLNKNREMLETLGIYDDFATSESLIRSQLQREATLTAREKAINGNTLLGVIAKSNNDLNPELILDQALKKPVILKELKQTVLASKNSGLSKTELEKTFQAAIMDRLLKTAPDAIENPTSFKKFLINKEQLLDSAFDKSHINNMYLVADAVERVLATGMSSGKGLRQNDIITALTAALGTSPAGISNRFIAVQEGRLGPRAAIGYVLSRAVTSGSNARSDALFREMMFNPDMARALTAEGPTNLSIPAPIARRLNAFLFSLGVDFDEFDNTTPAEPAKIELRPTLPDATNPNVPQTPDSMAVPEKMGNQSSVIAPPAPPPIANQQQQTQTASASDLFPFDPTLAAIEKRRNAKQGIMSVA